MKCQWVCNAMRTPPQVCSSQAEIGNYCYFHNLIWGSATAEPVDIDPLVMGGQPVVTGTRIPVKMVVELRRDNVSFKEIFEGWPTLQGKNLVGVIDWAKKNEDRL